MSVKRLPVVWILWSNVPNIICRRLNAPAFAILDAISLSNNSFGIGLSSCNVDKNFITFLHSYLHISVIYFKMIILISLSIKCILLPCNDQTSFLEAPLPTPNSLTFDSELQQNHVQPVKMQNVEFVSEIRNIFNYNKTNVCCFFE